MLASIVCLAIGLYLGFHIGRGNAVRWRAYNFGYARENRNLRAKNHRLATMLQADEMVPAYNAAKHALLTRDNCSYEAWPPTQATPMLQH